MAWIQANRAELLLLNPLSAGLASVHIPPAGPRPLLESRQPVERVFVKDPVWLEKQRIAREAREAWLKTEEGLAELRKQSHSRPGDLAIAFAAQRERERIGAEQAAERERERAVRLQEGDAVVESRPHTRGSRQAAAARKR